MSNIIDRFVDSLNIAQPTEIEVCEALSRYFSNLFDYKHDFIFEDDDFISRGKRLDGSKFALLLSEQDLESLPVDLIALIGAFYWRRVE